MAEGNKTIRFIDSDYNELFKIPDGGNIRIVYPPEDYRQPAIYPCKFIDECHVMVGIQPYHICEFAERMEAMGARYEPEVQIRGAELTPFSPGGEKFYTYNREVDNSCIGHVAGDFGQNGDRFYNGWYNHKTKNEGDWSECTPEFQTDLYSAVYRLRQDLLKDYNSMLAYCESHPEALLDSGDTYKRYGFKIETDTRQYYTQCFIGENRRYARFIIYAYDKERERPSVSAQIKSARQKQKRLPVPTPQKNKRIPGQEL